MEITDTLDRNLSLEQRDDWHLTELLGHNDGRSDPFAAAVRATRMPMVITDPNQIDNPIVFANKAFQNLTGYERSEIIGRNCRFLQGPETDRQDVEKIRRATEAGESIDVDLLNYRKDGSTFWNALFVSPVRDDAGNVVFFFASQEYTRKLLNANTQSVHMPTALERTELYVPSSMLNVSNGVVKPNAPIRMSSASRLPNGAAPAGSSRLRSSERS